MTLTQQQKQNTIREFHDNVVLTGLSMETIAKDLNTTTEKLSKLMSLSVESLEEPWILKNYLIEQIEKQGESPIPFTALVGDYHDYWFLDSSKIDKRAL